MSEKHYVAVRLVIEGVEWFDVATMSGSIQVTREKAQEIDAKIPIWAAANPVLRIAAVVVAEVDDEQA